MPAIIRAILAYSIFITLTLTGCSSSNDSSFNAGDLISQRKIATFTAEQSSAVLSTFYTAVASYDVDSYIITYKTPNTKGRLVTASGVLHIPKKDNGAKSPIVSFQHGTIFLNSEAPSNNLTAPTQGSLTAALGLITSEADYLGYGASDEMEHPYSHSKTLASSSIDMLRASKQFLKGNNILDNGQLFLMGYSMGGKATLAMQREISTKLSNEFTITASSPGSGNYDMSATTKAIFLSKTLSYPAFVAWIIQAYDSIYSLNMLDKIIEDDYLEATRTSFDRTQSGAEINAKLTTETSELIKTSFKTKYLLGLEKEMEAAVDDNNDFDWAPKAPTQLFYGQDDVIVPSFNSTNAFAKMIVNGSTSVQLITCDAGGAPTNHGNCAIPYLIHAYNFFTGIATDL